MDKTQFIKMFQEFEEEFKSEGGYPLTISSDKSIDARIIIDEDGFIWIRDYESWRRAKILLYLRSSIRTGTCLRRVLQQMKPSKSYFNLYIIVPNHWFNSIHITQRPLFA